MSEHDPASSTGEDEAQTATESEAGASSQDEEAPSPEPAASESEADDASAEPEPVEAAVSSDAQSHPEQSGDTPSAGPEAGPQGVTEEPPEALETAGDDETARLRDELAGALAARDKAVADLDAASARLRAVSKAFRDLQGEMDAFRKRQELQAKFKAERQSFEVVRAFLEPVQNLARSLETPGADVESLVHGLGMVHHQFMEALKGLGLESVPGVGAPFDPNVHEALGLTPVFDAEQDGKVLHVHSHGFMVNGKVVQAAQVVVGKLQESAGEA